jgi:hypothetical protein
MWAFCKISENDNKNLNHVMFRVWHILNYFFLYLCGELRMSACYVVPYLLEHFFCPCMGWSKMCLSGCVIVVLVVVVVIIIDCLCGLVVRVPGYRSRGHGFDSRRYQIFWEVVGLEWGPLSLVRMYVCIRGGTIRPLHRDLQWSIVLPPSLVIPSAIPHFGCSAGFYPWGRRYSHSVP